MFKYKYAIYRQLNIAVDAAIIALSFLIAMLIRRYVGAYLLLPSQYSTVYFPEYFWAFIFPLVFLWSFLLNTNGLYPTDRLRTLERASRIILKSSFQGLFLVFAFLFIFKLHDISRAVMLGFAAIASLLLILKEGLIIGYLHTLRKSGANFRNVLVVGAMDNVSDIVRTIVENKFLGLNVIGLLVPEGESKELVVNGYHVYYRVLGNYNDIEKVLHNHPIDHVIINIGCGDSREVENIVLTCEEEGVEVWVTSNIFRIKTAKLDSDRLFGMPMFVFRTVPTFSWQFFIKGIIDKAGALICGIISVPIIILAAAAIKITSKGPVLFKQRRCNIQGREFTLYKLRTMQINAQEKMKELKDKNILKGPVFKMTNDPRVTPIGRFLRRTSIDELPQLWNVLRGEMSLVGPRPPLKSEVDQYEKWQRRRLSMKPGITGLWQVSGRGTIKDFNKWVQFDLEYIDHWSLMLDIKIFLRTIVAVITGYGAQ